MVTLSAFGNIPERNSPIGYVWQRDVGWRIVIVIDDWFDIPRWGSTDNGDAPSSHAYGLTLLRDKLSDLDSTRAIGFFTLPDPQSKTLEIDTQQLINEISKWMFSVKDDNSQGYFLIDYYYGEGFSQANEVGSYVVKRLKSQELELHKSLGLPIKLAHISIGGAKKTSNPYGLEVFKKTDMHSTQQLPEKLCKWLDINSHPLSRLWDKSRHWFLAGRDEEDIMQHTRRNIEEYVENPQDGRLALYRYNIESALGLSLPDSWWQSSKSIGLLHESLKCLCGAMFCGECNEETLKRPISTGAAFLIALIAHYHHLGNIDPFVEHENIWVNCHKVATSFVFAKQDCKTAKESALALYALFCLLFEVRSGAGNNVTHRTSQVNSVLFGDQGRFLRIELAWNAHRKAIDSSESLSDSITKLLQRRSIKIPEPPPKNTREAILRLWMFMGMNEEGWFSPGIVHLNKNILTIGAVM